MEICTEHYSNAVLMEGTRIATVRVAIGID